MMRHPSTKLRPGFTLLEVLLASLIAILLLGALYFAMDMTMRQTAISREATDVENLSRGVFNRMALDLSCSLGPLPPKSGGNSASGANTSGSTATEASMMSSGDPMSMGTPTTGTGMPRASTDPTAGAAPTAPSSGTGDTGESTETDPALQPQAADIAFQGGVIGYENQLTIFVSQIPPALANTGELFLGSASGMQGPSDLWRITYWRGTNGQLCRQVRPWVTADGVRNSADPDLITEESDTLLPEVTDVLFEYWEALPDGGGSWITAWDGTMPGPDGITPTGPPRAIRVTLFFEILSSRPGGSPVTKSVQQVIPVRTAPGSYTPPMLEPSTDPGTVTPEDPAAMTDPASGSTGETSGMTPAPAAPAAPAAPSAPAAPGGGGTPAGGGMGGGRSGMGGGR